MVHKKASIRSLKARKPVKRSASTEKAVVRKPSPLSARTNYGLESDIISGSQAIERFPIGEWAQHLDKDAYERSKRFWQLAYRLESMVEDRHGAIELESFYDTELEAERTDRAFPIGQIKRWRLPKRFDGDIDDKLFQSAIDREIMQHGFAPGTWRVDRDDDTLMIASIEFPVVASDRRHMGAQMLRDIEKDFPKYLESASRRITDLDSPGYAYRVKHLLFAEHGPIDLLSNELWERKYPGTPL